MDLIIDLGPNIRVPEPCGNDSKVVLGCFSRDSYVAQLNKILILGALLAMHRPG